MKLCRKVLIDKYKFENYEDLLVGKVFLIENGKKYFEIRIKIDLQDLNEFKIPKVFILDDEIEPIPDNHVYKDGAICLCHPMERHLMYKRYRDNIEGFFNELIIPFFCAYTYKDLYGEWPSKTYSHSIDKANIELVEEYLNVRIINVAFLSNLTRKIAYNSNKCYCGSGKLLRKCHFNEMNNFRELFLSKEDMCNFLNQLVIAT